MESITIKVNDEMAEEIDTLTRPDYTTKTEFVREAIRDKIKELRKERLIAELTSYKGKGKKNTSDKEMRKIRIEVGNELREELKRKFR